MRNWLTATMESKVELELRIPDEVTQDQIAPYCDFETLSNLRLTNKNNDTFFKPMLLNERLLNAIAHDNRTKAKLLLEHFPELLLQKSLLRFPDKFIAEQIDFSKLFYCAASLGFVAILDQIKNALKPKQMCDLIAAEKYAFIKNAINSQQFETVEWIKKEAPQEFESVFNEYFFEDFDVAASNGQLEKVKWLTKLAPNKLDAMLAHNNYGALRGAACRNHAEVFQWIKDQDPVKFAVVVKEQIRSIIDYSYNLGKNPAVIQFFLPYPDYFSAIEKHKDDYTLNFVKNTLKMLCNKVYDFQLAHPDDVFNVTDESEIWLYFYMVKHLIRLNDQKLNCGLEFLLSIPSVNALVYKKVKTNLIELDSLAKEKANKEASDILLTSEGIKLLDHSKLQISKDEAIPFPEEKDFISISKSSYKAPERSKKESDDEYFIKTVDEVISCGDVEMAKRIQEQNPEAFQKIIDAKGFYGFDSTNRLGMMKWLRTQITQPFTPLLEVRDYGIFRGAAHRGSFDIILWIQEIEPEYFAEIIKTKADYFFHYAQIARNHKMVNFLFQFPECFAYAENRKEPYDFGYTAKYVHPYMKHRLNKLHFKIQDFQLAHPDGVFDITDSNEIKLYFYMARNIIRSNDRNLDKELEFLLSIPSVKALVHKETEIYKIELLEVAKASDNKNAMKLLEYGKGMKQFRIQKNQLDELNSSISTNTVGMFTEPPKKEKQKNSHEFCLVM